MACSGAWSVSIKVSTICGAAGQRTPHAPFCDTGRLRRGTSRGSDFSERGGDDCGRDPCRARPVAGRNTLAASYARRPSLGIRSLFERAGLFSMPTTAATSPWRPVAGRVLATSAGLSLVLLVVGFLIRQRQAESSDSDVPWLAPLVLGILPGVLYAFFWIIGPLY